MSQPKNYNAVLERVRRINQVNQNLSKEAGYHGLPTEKDPADKGTTAVPVDAHASASAQNLPDNRKELSSNPVPSTLAQLKPGPTGTNVPSTVDGKPKDEAFSSPTTDLSKIAASSLAIANRIKALQGATAAPANKEATTAPDATVQDMQINDDMLRKLAQVILSTEEGVKVSESLLVKAAGAEAARAIMGQAQSQYEQEIYAAVQQEELYKQAAAAEYQQLAAAEELLKSASVEEREAIVKIASAHHEALEQIPTELEKLAYQQGAQDAAAMMDAEQATGSPDLQGGQDAPLSLEEVAQVLMHFVQSGEVKPEEAEEILKALTGGGEGGMGGHDESPAAETLEGAPHAEPDADNQPKGDKASEESEKSASELVAELVG